MYETPDWVQVVSDVGTLVAVCMAVVAAVAAVGRFLIVKPLQSYIDQRTPRNGGKSLSELHGKVDVLVERVIRIEKEIIRIDGEIDHLAD